jgi:hypothetical protein
VCIPGRRGGLCVPECATDTDCRDEYRCAARTDDPSVMYCAPGCTSDAACTTGGVCNPGTGTCGDAFDPDALGEACSSDPGSLCPGGTCLREFESGFPGSYCAYTGCTVGGDDCPGSGVCRATGDGRGICLAGCADVRDCPRDGYDCRPSDAANPMSPLACMPACTTDMSCANDMYVCNNGTGLCTEAFDAADLGEPCDSAMSCTGGRCLTEAGAGWPAGTCAYPGCRLSGMGESETCPMGSACVDDAAGDPTLGICVDSCAMDTDCRPGYRCNIPMGAASGTCGPGCTMDSACSGGRTCEATTGLCRAATPSP